MAGDSSSAVAQRQHLRAELRMARREARLSQEQVAGLLGWPLSRVIRIEACHLAISVNDLRALLSQYQAVGPDKADEIISLAMAVRKLSWWSEYRNVASPAVLQLIGHETMACVSRSFEPLLVPGLLQTEEYAREIIRHFKSCLPAERAEDLVRLRMRRQELLDQRDPPSLFFVLDEAVVSRLAGGDAVMHRQIQTLADIATRPNVTIEIVPFTSGLHPGLTGPFVTLEFPNPADEDVLYLENIQGDLISRDAPEDVVSYRTAFELLRGISLGPDGSLAYLNRAAGQMP
jgi:hypothetical protein